MSVSVSVLLYERLISWRRGIHRKKKKKKKKELQEGIEKQTEPPLYLMLYKGGAALIVLRISHGIL